MNIYGYTGIIWKEADGYVSKCSELGVASCGDSFEEAIDNLREAVELYLENAKELGIIEEIGGRSFRPFHIMNLSKHSNLPVLNMHQSGKRGATLLWLKLRQNELYW